MKENFEYGVEQFPVSITAVVRTLVVVFTSPLFLVGWIRVRDWEVVGSLMANAALGLDCFLPNWYFPPPQPRFHPPTVSPPSSFWI